jgi:hypothetical protein
MYDSWNMINSLLGRAISLILALEKLFDDCIVGAWLGSIEGVCR